MKELSKQDKDAIRDALLEYCGNYPSQNRASESLNGVSAATVSQICNQKYTSISDDMFSRIAAQIGFSMDRWTLTESNAFQRITFAMSDAQAYKNTTWVVGDAGCGKTTAAIEYRRTHRNVFYILCSEDMKKSDFVREIAKQVGAPVDGTNLRDILEYAISMNWVDVSGLDVKASYLSSEEIYQVVVDYISTELENDVDFQTMLYKYMLLDDIVTGKEICLLLYEQGVLEYDEETVGRLQNGSYSAYNFMLDEIGKLEITPAQLALEPCSAGCVITDPNTGEVLACVSYPGYDNNRLTNTMDSAYFASLNLDHSSPLYSKATQQQTAPGSTFKPVTAVAGLEEGVISPSEIIHATGVFTDAYGSPTCWIYNQYHGSHGNINMVDAIRVSCNYYFYEVGFRLGGGRSTGYSSEKALSLLAKYATEFGLNAKSGIELSESDPQLSSQDGIRSAIGQGNALFTVSQLARYVGTIANRGTVYNLTLLDKLTDSEGNTIEDYPSSVYNKMEIADVDWNTIQEGLHQVALNTKAFDGLNLTIAGKTGTAQQSKSHPNHALFMGYAPYENPQIALAIRIANGYTSANAAAMASDIFKYYFNLEGKEDLFNGGASQATSEVIND